jgi:membrane-bound lytic murein transglycosylase A
VAHLKSKSQHPGFIFADRKISALDYVAAQELLIQWLRDESLDWQALQRKIESRFDYFESYGEKNGEAFITSYFEPWILGSSQPTSEYPQPLYARPQDLLILDLKPFDPKYKSDRVLRGRIEGKNILPYFSREDIDTHLALKGRKLELAWVNPIDAFFIQIQGSGVVHFSNGRKLILNYSDRNGHPYFPLGKILKEQGRLSPDQLNLRGIENYLLSLSPADLQTTLNQNPSYVFFEKSNQSATTSFGLPAVDGRTIATDSRLYSKGSIALLTFTRPGEKEAITRLVLDQDTGGAITGAGRVDLFWGRGDQAKYIAGEMKSSGRLIYLVPKL